MARFCYLLLALALSMCGPVTTAPTTSNSDLNFEINFDYLLRVLNWEKVLLDTAKSKGWSQKQLEEIRMEDNKKLEEIYHVNMEFWSLGNRQEQAMAGVGGEAPMEFEDYMAESMRMIEKLNRLTEEREKWLKGLN